MDADGLLDGGRAVDGEGARTSGSASVDVSVTDRDAAGTGSDASGAYHAAGGLVLRSSIECGRQH